MEWNAIQWNAICAFEFFDFDTFELSKKGIEFHLVPERLRGEVARFDFCDANGKVIVAKVNIDELPALTSRFNVKAVPTFIVFKGGKEVSRFTGYKTRKDLVAAVENI